MEESRRKVATSNSAWSRRLLRFAVLRKLKIADDARIVEHLGFRFSRTAPKAFD
jgi:hypothetical protein